MNSTASASLFLFDAAERSSLSAATEAAVQDIASEILEAEDWGKSNKENPFSMSKCGSCWYLQVGVPAYSRHLINYWHFLQKDTPMEAWWESLFGNEGSSSSQTGSCSCSKRGEYTQCVAVPCTDFKASSNCPPADPWASSDSESSPKAGDSKLARPLKCRDMIFTACTKRDVPSSISIVVLVWPI